MAKSARMCGRQGQSRGLYACICMSVPSPAFPTTRLGPRWPSPRISLQRPQRPEGGGGVAGLQFRVSCLKGFFSG